MRTLILPLLAAASIFAAAPLLLPFPAAAQTGAAKVAAAHASVKPTAIARGGKGLLVVTLSVGPQYHVNARKPNDPAYIPTTFTPQPLPGIKFGLAHYPAPKLMKLSYSPKPLLVYTGLVIITVPFTVTDAVKPGSLPLSGVVDFQGCDARSCFPPASAPVKATLMVK